MRNMFCSYFNIIAIARTLVRSYPCRNAYYDIVQSKKVKNTYCMYIYNATSNQW